MSSLNEVDNKVQKYLIFIFQSNDPHVLCIDNYLTFDVASGRLLPEAFLKIFNGLLAVNYI